MLNAVDDVSFDRLYTGAGMDSGIVRETLSHGRPTKFYNVEAIATGSF